MLTSKSIVLVNQFTNKNNAGHGKTPSKFVTNYMARNDATLTSYPVTNAKNTQAIAFDNQQSVFKVQQQKLLNRKAHYSRKRVTKQSWANLTTLEGRGFNEKSLSLSKDGIKDTAANLQQAFDHGHTVLEMVASFDNQYLTDLGIEKNNQPRDFHRDVDEMKLRVAVRMGCMSLAQDLGYMQPVFAGAIQLDRDHPHAHIALAETSSQTKARKVADGSEYGCLTKANRLSFIETVDNTLTNMQDLAFMPSNQTEQAQLSAENYTQKYQLLPQKKQMMLYQAATADNSLEPVLLKELSLRPYSHKTTQQKKRILQAQRQRESETKTQPLPLVYTMALQRNNELQQLNSPLAQLEARKRKMAAYANRLQERQKALLRQMAYFDHSLVNNPQQTDLIKQQIMPYYQQAISNNATKIDYASLFNYQPVKPIPTAYQQQATNLKVMQQTAKTPLAKAAFKEQALKTVVNWQLAGQTDSQNVVLIANSQKDDLKLPQLKHDPVANKRPTDEEFQHQPEMDGYEAILADKALTAIAELPETSMTKLATADLNLQHLQSRQSNRLNQAAKPLEPEKSMSIKPIKSVSYQEAEDLLVELT